MKLTFLAHLKISLIVTLGLSFISSLIFRHEIFILGLFLFAIGMAICEGLEEMIRRLASFESMMNEVRKEIRKLPEETARLNRR